MAHSIFLKLSMKSGGFMSQKLTEFGRKVDVEGKTQKLFKAMVVRLMVKI